MCDTLTIVQPGRVLFAKNSDRDPNEAQHLEWIPSLSHPPGSTVQCSWIEIPQVSRTNAVLLSRPFWMWGAEIGANEHGVVIGNEAVFTREPYRKQGLTGMDLLRLGLERAETAQQACHTIEKLIAEHGQGGGCGHEHRSFTYHNSFIIADPNGAFVLETAGQASAVEEVHGARSISNGLTIPEFADKHSDWLHTTVSQCRVRRKRTEALGRTASGVADLIEILSDHGEGNVAPNYRRLNGAMAAPCMHAGGLAASAQTTGSWIAELRPHACQHWVTGTSAPCISLFKPVSVTRPVDLGPRPTDQYEEQSLWWMHERFHRLAMMDLASAREVFDEKRRQVQREWIAAPPDSAQAFLQSKVLLGEWTRELHGRRLQETRPSWVRRYWEKRNHRARTSV